MLEYVLKGAMFAACVMLSFAYICRIDKIQFSTVRLRFVAFHVGALIYCGSQAIDVWTSQAIDFGRIGLVPVWLWLHISYQTWHSGPPRHAMRKMACSEVMQ